jgi:tRNA threonylcarbamoyladenosine biosynthesis protein TsaB
MYSLGIDTSSAVGSVAISRDGVSVCRRTISVEMKHSENILPAMKNTIADAGISMKELGAVAVGVGPGSYTGVRVGIAFAKGIAFGLKIPVVGVCSFESMLFAHKGFGGIICTLVDAKMGGTFWAAYRLNEGIVETLKSPTVSRTQDIEFDCGGNALFISPDIEKFMDILDGKFRPRGIVGFKETYPDATWIAVLGERRILEKSCHPEIKLEPYYLRPSMDEMTFPKQQDKQ